MNFEEFTNTLVACPKMECEERHECNHGNPHIRDTMVYVTNERDSCKCTYDSNENIICPACEPYPLEFLSLEEMTL